MPRLTKPVTQQDHALGPADAPVTLVEYGDFECPHCGQAYPILQQILHELEGQIRFVYRHFPLTETHPHAGEAAEAAEGAGAQGFFWEMHALLFENQAALKRENLLAYARKLGLKEDRFVADLDGHVYQRLVQDDFMSGVRSGVNGTPTFFINAERMDQAWDYDTLMDVLRAAIRENQ